MIKFMMSIFFIFYAISQERSMGIKKISSQIKIDGIEDPIWKTVDSESDFKQEEPNPLEPASKRTEFKLLYDNENLYIYGKMYQEKSTVISQIGKRETNTHDGDNIQVFIDPNLDKTTGYVFGVTPSNKQYDLTMYNDNQFFSKWDAIWESAVVVTEDYWTVEMKIPLRVLKFQDKEVQDWGFNFERYLKHKGEWSQWQAFRPETGTRISTIGRITGLEGLKSRQELIVRPSLLSVFDSESDYDPTENQLMDLNLRYNINAENSIVAAIKPDFAQIETDQNIINYSDYPTRLVEKRPFFLEGNEIFLTHNEYYYSRRMVKPNVAAKFIGSNDNLKYAFAYIQNDGLTNNVLKIRNVSNTPDSTYSSVRYNEDFIFTRLKYVSSNLYEFSYLGQYVKSEYQLSGALHAFDFTYRPDESLQFDGLYGKTVIEDNYAYINTAETKKNYNFKANAKYKSRIWDVYYTHDHKTIGFEQNLAGFNEVNNRIMDYFTASHKTRFKKYWIEQFSLSYHALRKSTTSNDVSGLSHTFRSDFNFRFQDYGAVKFAASIEVRNGDIRQYDFTNNGNQNIYRDNFGSFIGIEDKATAGYVSLSTDRSKRFSLSSSYSSDKFKQSDLAASQFGVNLKAKDNLEFEFSLSHSVLDGSNYVDKGEFTTYSLKTEYAPLYNLFIKSYIQLSDFDEKLVSNNLIVSYEYTRGNFIYLSYNESGKLWENNEYTKGAILENYDLYRRTISLKWSNSFYF